MLELAKKHILITIWLAFIAGIFAEVGLYMGGMAITNSRENTSTMTATISIQAQNVFECEGLERKFENTHRVVYLYSDRPVFNADVKVQACLRSVAQFEEADFRFSLLSDNPPLPEDLPAFITERAAEYLNVPGVTDFRPGQVSVSLNGGDNLLTSEAIAAYELKPKPYGYVSTDFKSGDTIVAQEIQLTNGTELRNNDTQCLLRNAPADGVAFERNINFPTRILTPGTAVEGIADCKGFTLMKTVDYTVDKHLFRFGVGVARFTAGTPYVFGVIYLDDGRVFGESEGCYILKPSVSGTVRAPNSDLEDKSRESILRVVSQQALDHWSDMLKYKAC